MTRDKYLPAEVTVTRSPFVQPKRVQLFKAEVEGVGSLAGKLGVRQLAVRRAPSRLAVSSCAAAVFTQQTRVFGDHLVFCVSHFYHLNRKKMPLLPTQTNHLAEALDIIFKIKHKVITLEMRRHISYR